MTSKAVAEDDMGEYVQRWACEPPPVGTRFKVLRDEWSDDYTVRTIYEIEVPE